MSDAPAPDRVLAVNVAIDRTVEELDRVFTYRVPAGWSATIKPGMRVRVPLGRGRATGLIIATALADPVGLKFFDEVLDPEPLISQAVLELAQWMADRYHCYLSQALRAVIPSAVRRGVTPQREEEVYAATGRRQGRPSRRQELWEWLTVRGPSPRKAILEVFPGAQDAIRALQREGTIKRMVPAGQAVASGRHILNADQGAAVAALEDGQKGIWLLEGVTGSGKTEVYLRRVASAVAKAQQALVMVPEIALTPQTVARFRERFGTMVALWHSGLSAGDRVAVWEGVRRGTSRVVVGARSAVFLPFARLGVIVLDEEHEASYKQEEHPRYHTREVAIWRARREGAQVILGSATPSLETAWRARTGRIGWLTLPQRVEQRRLPPIDVVDMREELRSGNRDIFSRRLQELTTRTLAEGRQVIFFLNRRGFASFVLCRDCGQAVHCPSCAVTMTYHQTGSTGARLECHYCFRVMPPPPVCPHCASRRIRYFGAGTERISEEVARLWPAARVMRADRDTITTRQGYTEFYERFSAGSADVLVGTQMIAKGMDFPRVGLVGVVSADTALHLPDFRSGERTFQLLVQASGRAGRGDEPGHVVIQTYNPDHYAVVHAKAHDFGGFYEQELQYRRDLGYPPFEDVWLLELHGPQEAEVAAAAGVLADNLRKRLPDARVLGAAPAPISRVRDRFRYHILIRSRDRQGVSAAVRALGPDDGMRITVDPYNML
ncbi:MAG: primosomal protein N' [Thermaerobacter sp.]|nr:primosomal protein N' [Thermaerobacter sp.]